MTKALLAAIFLICCSLPAAAASLEELTPYFSGRHFTWEEHSDGRRLLRERGTLFAAGLISGGVTEHSVTFRGRAELFGGVVDYGGETQAPQSLPIGTDVDYLGARGEFDLGYRRAFGAVSLEPFAGIGYRWWLRGLQDTRGPSGDKISGYTERWQTAYARLGSRGRYQAASGIAVFAEGGAKYPVFTGNTVDFAGYGTTTFRPGGRWSAFSEAGVQWRQLKLALSYEGFRFSQSPLKLVGTRLFFQPDSTSDVFGLSLGWAFR